MHADDGIDRAERRRAGQDPVVYGALRGLRGPHAGALVAGRKPV